MRSYKSLYTDSKNIELKKKVFEGLMKYLFTDKKKKFEG